MRKRSFIKRAMLAPVLLLALSAVPTAGSADGDPTIATQVRKGSVKVLWNQALAATEVDWVCGSEPHTLLEGGLQGFDAYIMKLPEGSEGQRIEMTHLRMAPDRDATALVLAIPDIDVYFADAECAHMSNTSMATGTPLEKSTVPEGAKYAIAFLFAGAPSYFTFEIDYAAPAV